MLALAALPLIKFLSASAVPTAPIEMVLTPTAVHFPAPLHNFKLSVVFDRKLPIKKVHLESCAKEWGDGIQLFTSPNLGRQFVEGGKTQFDLKLPSDAGIEALAIVFGRDSELCLKNLKFFDAKDQPIFVQATESIQAKTQQATALFDQHPDTTTSLEDPVTVTFDEKQTFDRAFVWTGGGNFYAHALKLKGGAWSETLPLRNSSADQEIIFKKPFKGSTLTMQAPDAGEIGEIRFGKGTKVESLQISSSFEALKKKFIDAVFDRTLDMEWSTSDEDKWLFDFRADGTFFVRGFTDDSKQARDYSALGSFTVVRAEKNKIRMKINGVRFPTSIAWDGVSCPYQCGSEGSLEGAQPVSDTLVLEKIDEGSMMVRNRTPRQERTLTFGDLKLHRSVDD